MPEATPALADLPGTRGRPSLWCRLLVGNGALGPGKAELLRLIDELGSVSEAARRMRMSHARSVKLVAELNAIGAGPLIATRSGGEAGGGASLTDRGRTLLGLLGDFDDAVFEAAAPHLARIDEELRRG